MLGAAGSERSSGPEPAPSGRLGTGSPGKGRPFEPKGPRPSFLFVRGRGPGRRSTPRRPRSWGHPTSPWPTTAAVAVPWEGRGRPSTRAHGLCRPRLPFWSTGLNPPSLPRGAPPPPLGRGAGSRPKSPTAAQGPSDLRQLRGRGTRRRRATTRWRRRRRDKDGGPGLGHCSGRPGADGLAAVDTRGGRAVGQSGRAAGAVHAPRPPARAPRATEASRPR